MRIKVRRVGRGLAVSISVNNLSRGAWLGGATSFLLSVAYTFWIMAGFMAISLTGYHLGRTDSPQNLATSLLNSLNFVGLQVATAMICILPFALVLGIVPGVLLGSVIGTAIHWVVIRSGWATSEVRAIVLSILTGSSWIALCSLGSSSVMLFPLLFSLIERPGGIRMTSPAALVVQVPYIFAFLGTILWLGPPALISLAASAWLGRKLYREKRMSLVR
jgi:hypothetical protein